MSYYVKTMENKIYIYYKDCQYKLQLQIRSWESVKYPICYTVYIEERLLYAQDKSKKSTIVYKYDSLTMVEDVDQLLDGVK